MIKVQRWKVQRKLHVLEHLIIGRRPWLTGPLVLLLDQTVLAAKDKDHLAATPYSLTTRHVLVNIPSSILKSSYHHIVSRLIPSSENSSWNGLCMPASICLY